MIYAYWYGNGTCRYLENTVCSIYERRPVFCNVEAMYKTFFKATMTETQFITVNLKACQEIAEYFQDTVAVEKIKQVLLALI